MAVHIFPRTVTVKLNAKTFAFGLLLPITTSALAQDGIWDSREDWQRVNVSSGRPVITPFKPGDDIFQPFDAFAERPRVFLTEDEVLVGKPERLTAPDADSLIVRQDNRSITFKVPSASADPRLTATAFYEEQKIAGIEVRPDQYSGFLLFRGYRPEPPLFSKGAACLAHQGVEYSKPVFVIDMARTVPADYVAQYLRENARSGYGDAAPVAGVWMGNKWEKAPEEALDRTRYGAAVWYQGSIHDAQPIERGRVGEERACRVFNAIAVADITAYYATLKRER